MDEAARTPSPVTATAPVDFDYPFGTPAEPSIGGVPWDGGLHLTPHPDVEGDPAASLFWRISFDLMWIMANLVTILSKATNRPINFKLNRPQMWVMWNLLDMLARGEPIRLWCLKGRQFGYSTLFTTILFICSAMRGQNSLLLAHLEKPGKSIFRKAEMALKTMPELELTEEDEETGKTTTTQLISVVEPPTGTEKESLLSWVGRGFAAVFRRESAENRDAGVGETYQNIQLTEVPLFADAEHTIPGLAPAMSQAPGSIMVGEFTARNEGDFAHKRWIRAALGKSVYRAVFAAWYWMLTPGCDHANCSCYARAWRPTDGPITPEEEEYRTAVALKGHEYPLDEDGFLVRRLRQMWDRGERINLHHIAVGFVLTDEQLLFRRDMIEEFNGDYAMWRREFPATPEEAFQVAGRKLIPGQVMDKMDAFARDPLDTGEYTSHLTHGGKARTRFEKRRDGRVHRFEKPQPGAVYEVWCDPSSGTGDDPTGMGVDKIEFGKTTTVVTFEGYVRPHEAARIAARMGRHYRCNSRRDSETGKLVGGAPAYISVERNGFGEAFITELLDRIKYRRVRRYTEKMKDNAPKGHDYGFPTKKNTKKAMLLTLARGCYGGNVVVPCRRLLASLRCMQYLDDLDEKIGAPRGQHDDLAMGRGIGFHFASQTATYRIKPVDDDLPAWLRERLSGMFRRTG